MKTIPIQLFAAAEHTRRAILQQIYSQYNFPPEAATLTISLHTAIELLLRYEIGDTKSKMVKLVDEKEDWNPNQKRLAHWVRQRRNDVMHRGEFPSTEQDIAIGSLEKAIHLLGSQWIDLVGSIADLFSDYEISILFGRNPDWQDESEFIARAALGYCQVDPKAAVTMSNLAFDIAARGFAFAWGIANVNEMEIPELISEMDLLEDDMAHLSLYSDLVDPETNFKEFGGDHAPWFYPPLDIDEVLVSQFDWSPIRAAYYYCQEILDVLISYPERVPFTSFSRCLMRNWFDIVRRLSSQYPSLGVPEVDINRLKDWNHYCGSSLYLPGPSGVFDMFKPSDILDDAQLKSFRYIVEEICGPIPSALQL